MLIMIKPGQTTGEANNEFVGQLNSDLTDRGILDATEIAITLKLYDLDYIFCSDSKQARDTWGIVKANAPLLQHKTPIICPQLRDRSGGVLEGLDWKAIRKQLPPRRYKLWERDFTEFPEMGESLMDVEDRVLGVLRSRVAPLLRDGVSNNVLLIADGVVINMIIKRLQKLTESETFMIGAQSGVPYFHHGSLKL